MDAFRSKTKSHLLSVEVANEPSDHQADDGRWCDDASPPSCAVLQLRCTISHDGQEHSVADPSRDNTMSTDTPSAVGIAPQEEPAQGHLGEFLGRNNDLFVFVHINDGHVGETAGVCRPIVDIDDHALLGIYGLNLVSVHHTVTIGWVGHVCLALEDARKAEVRIFVGQKAVIMYEAHAHK